MAKQKTSRTATTRKTSRIPKGEEPGSPPRSSFGARRVVPASGRVYRVEEEGGVRAPTNPQSVGEMQASQAAHRRELQTMRAVYAMSDDAADEGRTLAAKLDDDVSRVLSEHEQNIEDAAALRGGLGRGGLGGETNRRFLALAETERRMLSEARSTEERMQVRERVKRERARLVNEHGVRAVSTQELEDLRHARIAEMPAAPSNLVQPRRPELRDVTPKERKLMTPEEREMRLSALREYDTLSVAYIPEEDMYAPSSAILPEEWQEPMRETVNLRRHAPREEEYETPGQAGAKKLVDELPEEVMESLDPVSAASVIDKEYGRWAELPKDEARRQYNATWMTLQAVREARGLPVDDHDISDDEWALAIAIRQSPARKGVAGRFQAATRAKGELFETPALDESGHALMKDGKPVMKKVWLPNVDDKGVPIADAILSKYAGGRKVSGSLISAYKYRRRPKRDLTLRNVLAQGDAWNRMIRAITIHHWFDRAVASFLSRSVRERKKRGNQRLDIFLVGLEHRFPIPREMGAEPSQEMLDRRAEERHTERFGLSTSAEADASIFDDLARLYPAPVGGYEQQGAIRTRSDQRERDRIAIESSSEEGRARLRAANEQRAAEKREADRRAELQRGIDALEALKRRYPPRE